MPTSAKAAWYALRGEAVAALHLDEAQKKMPAPEAPALGVCAAGCWKHLVAALYTPQLLGRDVSHGKAERMAEPVDFAKFLKRPAGDEQVSDRIDESADCIQILVDAIEAMRKTGLSRPAIADLLRHAARELE